jgi:hypothetical protein
MMSYQELWENRDKILSNTREFLKRVKNKKTKFTEQTKRKLNESGDTKDSKKTIGVNPDEVKKIQWVITNKFLPMLKKVGELQKDMEFLDSAKFGQWNIPKEELREDKELLFKDKKVKVKTWKEGTSNPTSKTFGSPLEFTSYTIDGELSPQGKDNFIDWVEKRHHPNDFVWGNRNRRQEETSVFVMKNPSLKGLEVNGKRPQQKGSKKKVVSEVIKDELGDDYTESRPSPHLSWRMYLAKGRPKGYYPKDRLTLIWKYESTPEAKRKKELELMNKYPNKTLEWMEIPYLSVATIE